MRRSCSILLLLSGASLVLTALGCAQRVPLPPPSGPLTPTPDASFRSGPPQPWPALDELTEPVTLRTTLPNGLELICVEKRQVALVSLRYVTRSAAELQGGVAPGLAQLTAEALVESTRDKAGDVLLGLRVGGVKPEQSVSYSGTRIGYEVTSRAWRPALETLASVVQRPAYDEQSVAEIRRRLLERVHDSGQTFAGVALPLTIQTLLGDGDPWAITPRALVESIRQLRRSDLVDYHRRSYRPTQAALIVVGDVDAREVEALARQHFGAWEPAPGDSRATQLLTSGSLPSLGRSKGRRVLAVFSSGPQAYLLLPQPAVGPSHPDRVPLELITEILAGGFQSRAVLALRHGAGITYGVDASISGGAERGYLQISSIIDQREIQNGVQKLEQELERLRTQPVEERELEAARTAYLSRTLAGTIAGEADRLASLFLIRQSDESLASQRSRIDAVTPADLARVAREYLRPQGDIVVIGDFRETRSQLEALGTVKYLEVR